MEAVLKLLLYLVFCVITAYLAKRKGYNPIIWFFAAGVVGLIILAFLPFTNKGNLTEEERRKKVKIGNTIGIIVIVTAFIVVVLFEIFASLTMKTEFKKIEAGANREICELLATKIIIALNEYEAQYHTMPPSLHDSEFVNQFLNGELPEHPLGWDWDNYYNPDKPIVFKNGKGQGPIDVDSACNF